MDKDLKKYLDNGKLTTESVADYIENEIGIPSSTRDICAISYYDVAEVIAEDFTGYIKNGDISIEEAVQCVQTQLKKKLDYKSVIRECIASGITGRD